MLVLYSSFASQAIQLLFDFKLQADSKAAIPLIAVTAEEASEEGFPFHQFTFILKIIYIN